MAQRPRNVTLPRCARSVVAANISKGCGGLQVAARHTKGRLSGGKVGAIQLRPYRRKPGVILPKSAAEHLAARCRIGILLSFQCLATARTSSGPSIAQRLIEGAKPDGAASPKLRPGTPCRVLSSLSARAQGHWRGMSRSTPRPATHPGDRSRGTVSPSRVTPPPPAPVAGLAAGQWGSPRGFRSRQNQRPADP